MDDVVGLLGEGELGESLSAIDVAGRLTLSNPPVNGRLRRLSGRELEEDCDEIGRALRPDSSAVVLVLNTTVRGAQQWNQNSPALALGLHVQHVAPPRTFVPKPQQASGESLDKRSNARVSATCILPCLVGTHDFVPQDTSWQGISRQILQSMAPVVVVRVVGIRATAQYLR